MLQMNFFFFLCFPTFNCFKSYVAERNLNLWGTLQRDSGKMKNERHKHLFYKLEFPSSIVISEGIFLSSFKHVQLQPFLWLPP